jgi:hypothetical protein
MVLTVPAFPLLASAVAACALIAAATVSNEAYTVRRTEAAAVDLWESDAAWADANRIEWGTEPWPTAFRAVAAADALWLRFDATDDSPWYTMTGRDDRLGEEEVDEIFIDPDGDGRNYVEVEINPANAICDLLIASATPRLDGDITWDFAGIETKVDTTDTGWTTIVRLPWSGFESVPDTDVGLPPASGDRWHFNVFRIKRPGGAADPGRDLVLDAWSPVPGGSFHVPDVFRPMEFE